MFPFCVVLLIGLKAAVSDLGETDGFDKGGLVQRGGGGGGVVLTLLSWVGECCVADVGNV